MERIVEGICIDYTHDGKGVLKIDKMPIFVDNLLIGEKAKIKITKICNKYYEGKVIELLSVSKERVKPICDHYKDCGGCQLLHMSYDEQLRFKAKRVKDVIKRIGGIDVEEPIIHGMDNPYNYRNKVQMPIGITHNGTIIAGFYHNSSHQIINMYKCYIEDNDASKIIQTIKKLVKKYDIEPCDINSGFGNLRYVIIRKSFTNSDILVVLVTKEYKINNCKRFITELTEKHKNIKTIVQNINTSRGSVVLGDKENILYGDGYIKDKICNLTFNISAHSFYQINPIQTEILYSKAIELANLTKKDILLDAYCGVGTIGLIASKYAKEVKGVELVRSAIKDAKENAKQNNIKNIDFVCADATNFIFNEAKYHKNYDVMIFDPPRDGCSKKFISSVLKMKPKRIVYVSCDPSSLARDLVELKKLYDVKHVECVDMFPQTYHVETIVSLIIKQ